MPATDFGELKAPLLQAERRAAGTAAAASAVRASTENSHSATGLWARFLAVFQEPDSITTGPNRAVGRPGGSEPDAAAPALKTLYRVMAADEIERIVLILRRWSMNSAILVGTPGVRRTAIAEGVAWRVAAGVVPKARVVEIAGKEGYDAFLERLEKAEADDYWEVVLFIEDVHLLLGSAKGVTDLLKSGMEDGYFHCVCTTTLEEYRKHVQKDAAFERLFQKVHVQEPSLLETISVLQGLKNQYQKRHNAVIEDAAIVAAARLANRHITGQQSPYKAIDLIAEACAAARMQADNLLKENGTEKCPEIARKKVTVSAGQIAQVVSEWTSIPANSFAQDEKEKLIHLADSLHKRVVGQQEAVNLVAQAVLRSKSGQNQPSQPIVSFLFLGSTGVGKTELAKALAEQLFDSETMLIRLNMADFFGIHAIQRLIGAPPSYQGRDGGGQLTDKVRKLPYSVILLNEIEKAGPEVFQILLQLLGDGVLTDGKGRTVNFKNTIIIMTSSVGADILTKAMTSEKSLDAARGLVIKQAGERLEPDLVSMLSGIVVFEPLSQDNMREVAKIQMKGIIDHFSDKGITVFASDSALDVALSLSHNPVYGARPIIRWLQMKVTNKLHEMLIKGELAADAAVIVDATEDKKDLQYIVVKDAAPPAAGEAVMDSRTEASEVDQSCMFM
ncbi:hypothetical protein QOZ80_2BG0188530 [Eleusine coracana subsp. coracana]|nr:hypothetical protein QOZ80_2BG0188530 [Eleusine coracana subsp. coracana]